MADYIQTGTMTSVAALDNSVFTEMDQAFLIAAQPKLAIMDQFCAVKKQIGAKAIEMPLYAALAEAVTPLTDKEEVNSVAMSDSQIILTPAEYGNVVTKTKLVDLQSGGKSAIAAAQLVGMNMGRTLNKLALNACEASSNKITPTGAAEANMTLADVMTPTFLNKLYNKLQRQGIPTFPNGKYVLIAHADQIYDLKAATGAGSWQDIMKYSRPEEVLAGTVGELCGFDIIESTTSVGNGSASGSIDSYTCVAMGWNALGKAISLEPTLRITPSGDKLSRFENIGWYGAFQYKILDTNNIYLGLTTSSVGENT
jgi:N4-gp56 family major capsid protein